MISVESVTKRYGELHAVRDLSFEVRPAEVVGFLGPNGAGKTTMMRILTGSLQPDVGFVRFDGRNIGEDLRAARSRIGYLPETNALYPEMLVSEYLTFTCELRGIVGHERTRAIARAAGLTELSEVFTRPISQLSKGYRQRVGLAAAILHEPDVLFLDEPTEGLDPNQRVGIRQLIRNLGRDHTVLLSTHVLAEVEAICSRLLIINRGRLVADGSASDLLDARGAVRYVVEARGDGVSEQLESMPGVTSAEAQAIDGRVRVTLTADEGNDLRPLVFETAKQRGWTLWELHRERESLEQLFRSLTTEADREDGARAEPAGGPPGPISQPDLQEGGAP